MRKSLLSAFISLLAAASMSQDGKPFTVIFKPGSHAQKISKYFLEYNGKRVRDSAELKGDKVTFTGKINTIGHARIGLMLPQSDGSTDVEFVTLILEPATITIDATAGFEAARYAGTRIQSEYDEWQKGILPMYLESREKWGNLFRARNNKDTEKQRKLEEEIEVLAKKILNFQEAFMKKYSRSPVTALMLEEYVTPVWDNLEQAEQIYANLEPEIKELPDVKKFGDELKLALELARGNPFPDFTLPDASGKPVSVTSYRGKYVLLDFWASWCGPCRQESPTLVTAYQKYKDKGFDIFSVSFDKNRVQWLKAVEADQYAWQNVVDTTGMGRQGKLSSRFKIMAIPRNFLLDPEGRVVATNLRGGALERKLKEIFPDN